MKAYAVLSHRLSMHRSSMHEWLCWQLCAWLIHPPGCTAGSSDPLPAGTWPCLWIHKDPSGGWQAYCWRWRRPV